MRLLVTPTEYSTVKRVRDSLPQIKGDILITYGDVFIDVNLDAYYKFYKHLPSGSSASISAIKRNLSEVADVHREAVSSQKLKDVGFLAIKHQDLCEILNESVIEDKIERLIERSALHMVYCDNWSYLSLTDQGSLADARRQIDERFTIILDRDGVINYCGDKGNYITNVRDLVINNAFLVMLRKASHLISRVIVLTNQPWIGETEENLGKHNEIMERILLCVRSCGISDVAYLYCQHEPDELCDCRKPKAGLIEGYLINCPFLRKKTLFIGDSMSDRACAEKMGVSFMMYSADDPLSSNESEDLLSNLLEY